MNFWPGKGKHLKLVEPVADLDAIIAEPVHFRFKGKIHELKPISVEEYLKFTNAQAKMNNRLADDNQKLEAKELAEMYHGVVASVCDSISVDDILGMEQAQIAALYQLIIDLVTGQVRPGEAKKKSRQKIPIYESVVPLSSPSAPASSDGPTETH